MGHPIYHLELVARNCRAELRLNDLPLISLGDGAPELALDTLIKLPLSSEAASGAKIQSGYNHTAMVCFFDALPEAAVVAIAS